MVVKVSEILLFNRYRSLLKKRLKTAEEESEIKQKEFAYKLIEKSIKRIVKRNAQDLLSEADQIGATCVLIHDEGIIFYNNTSHDCLNLKSVVSSDNSIYTCVSKVHDHSLHIQFPAVANIGNSPTLPEPSKGGLYFKTFDNWSYTEDRKLIIDINTDMGFMSILSGVPHIVPENEISIKTLKEYEKLMIFVEQSLHLPWTKDLIVTLRTVTQNFRWSTREKYIDIIDKLSTKQKETKQY